MTSRDDWRRARFGDMAENITARVDDPSEAGVERYVGLEHLDPGSLSISRWGQPTDVEATKLRFWPGDVIFGRRRAYQRKLAVADFEGICSAHALVLRAKPDVVLPEFLPVFMQSDVFFERALAISVGSLSPTINWKTLKEQEFVVPPIREQGEIAELLWATHRARTSWQNARLKLTTARASLFDHLLELLPSTPTRLGSLLELAQYGTSKRCSDEPVDGAVPVLRIPNVVSGSLDLSDLKWAEFSTAERELYGLRAGDVLVVRTNGNPEYVGRGLAVDEDAPTDSVFASYLIRLRPRRDVLEPDFLAALLAAPACRAALRGSIRSSAGNYNLNATSIKALEVRIPAVNDQRMLLRQLEDVSSVTNMVEQVAAVTTSVNEKLSEALLGRS